MPMEQSRNRLNILCGTILGLICALLITVGGYIYIPMPLPYLPTLHDRLTFTLRWQLLPLTVLLLAVISQSIGHVLGEGQHVRSFTNSTVDQVVLTCVSHLAFSTYVEETAMKFIPLSSLLFVFGKIVLRNAKKSNLFRRSFGLTLVLFSPCIASLYSLFCLSWRGAGLRLGRPPIY